MDIVLENGGSAKNRRKPRQRKKSQKKTKPSLNRWMIFPTIVAGNLTHSFWVDGWRFLADPAHGMSIGSLAIIGVRVVLGVCAAALSFSSICDKLEEAGTDDPRVCYFLAFQQGFAFQAAFAAMTGSH